MIPIHHFIRSSILLCFACDIDLIAKPSHTTSLSYRFKHRSCCRYLVYFLVEARYSFAFLPLLPLLSKKHLQQEHDSLTFTSSLHHVRESRSSSTCAPSVSAVPRSRRCIPPTSSIQEASGWLLSAPPSSSIHLLSTARVRLTFLPARPRYVASPM